MATYATRLQNAADLIGVGDHRFGFGTIPRTATDQAAGSRCGCCGYFLFFKDRVESCNQFVLGDRFLGVADSILVVDSPSVPNLAIAINNTNLRSSCYAQSIGKVLCWIFEKREIKPKFASMGGHLGQAILDIGIDSYECDTSIAILLFQFNQFGGIEFGERALGSNKREHDCFLGLEFF